jgi:DsbC/DsbD-like thiol-disulfide interchange protein
MMKRFCLFLAALAASPASLPTPAAAQTGGFVVMDDVVQITLLPGWREASGRHIAALQVDLAPGWKTYWRSPGEGGIPPAFDWSGSINMQAVALHWPTPHAFDQLGLTSIGYETRLILPLEFTPARPDAPIRVVADLQIGVCQDICLPVSRIIRAELSSDARRPDPAIRAALADRPLTAAEAGLRGLTCTLSPIEDGLAITARIDLPGSGGREAVVFEPADPGIWVSDSVIRREGRVLTARAEMAPPDAIPLVLDRSTLRVTVVGRDRSIAMQGCTAP